MEEVNHYVTKSGSGYHLTWINGSPVWTTTGSINQILSFSGTQPSVIYQSLSGSKPL